MTSSIGSVFKSFWHTMTSYDRHSTYDSPYRTGRHVPLDRHGGLTSVSTASESRADVTSTYHDDHRRQSLNYDGGVNGTPLSPSRPYSPGMRSLDQRQTAGNDGFETQSPAGEIPMQSFQDGMPPAPPVKSSWAKIDAWAEENYPELFDQLCEGCTVNDLNELEHQLDCSLPQDVRESLQIHDGQERGGNPTGIIFGSMLLDCEEIVQEWENWRRVNTEFLHEASLARPPPHPKPVAGSSSQASSSKSASSPGPNSRNPNWRQDLLSRQDSVPPAAVQRAYAHPAWIPLVRDWGGNNLAVDLSPGPRGTWGQIVLFGRDYDTKYVVARSWAHFIAIVADDLGSGRWFVDEDNGELKLREFKKARVEPGYFDILRWRMDQKFGRSQNKRRSHAPGTASPSGSVSPYASPIEPNGEVSRGRSMQRLSNISPMPSPIRPGYGKPSPLARVAEEAPAPLEIKTNNIAKPEKLVEVETPRQSGDGNKENLLALRLTALTNGTAAEPEAPAEPKGTGQVNGQAKEKTPAIVEETETMKTIEI
ncbi:hypothetical protein B0T14DRAFT_125554 [Immersiella caudata]|uniref:Knr4/Smi1-like domain-containing protein n=1 Tax=Immersiella caudata TaxID=314043 RepID=A0AA39X4A8_9PEZI|nr:hypothetical protein B0T14DRAFT_125554 [Immersiella caudata]